MFLHQDYLDMQKDNGKLRVMQSRNHPIMFLPVNSPAPSLAIRLSVS